MFVYEWLGILLDIMMVVKGIGGGFLFGVVVVMENVVKGMMVGIYGLIYGGNLLGCVVGVKVIEIVSDDVFLVEVCCKIGILM